MTVPVQLGEWQKEWYELADGSVIDSSLAGQLVPVPRAEFRDRFAQTDGFRYACLATQFEDWYPESTIKALQKRLLDKSWVRSSPNLLLAGQPKRRRSIVWAIAGLLNEIEMRWRSKDGLPVRAGWLAVDSLADLLRPERTIAQARWAELRADAETRTVLSLGDLSVLPTSTEAAREIAGILEERMARRLITVAGLWSPLVGESPNWTHFEEKYGFDLKRYFGGESVVVPWPTENDRVAPFGMQEAR